MSSRSRVRIGSLAPAAFAFEVPPGTGSVKWRPASWPKECTAEPGPSLVKLAGVRGLGRCGGVQL